MQITRNLSEVSIPDCLDPDAPIAVGRDLESISYSISGEGVLAASAEPVWRAAAKSHEPVPVKVEIEFSTGIVTWTGLAQIDSISFGAEQGGRVTIEVSMQSDGDWVDTDTFS